LKALTLTIQAFGPFAKTQKIDFSLFGESSLYLINGNTGSGKTTILDAISFALYGDTTGKEREASDMRCDYADANLPTEVIFEFKLGEKIYRIQRMPKQEIKKSRGEGTTTKAAEANLWEVDADGEESLIVPRKVSDVTKKVIELMGLNSEQFRQVMVLPQGRFRELLLADSKDREDIFSQLFQTQIYKQVEEDIKAQAKSVKERIEAYHIKMSGILETVDLSSEEEVEESILSLDPEHKTHQLQKITAADGHKRAIEENQVAEGLQQQFENLKIEQETLTQHQLQQPHVDSLEIAMQRAMSADKIRTVFEAMQGLKQDKILMEATAQTITLTHQAAAKKLIVAEKNWQAANVGAQALDELSREHDKLQTYQGAIQTLEQAYSEMQTAKQQSEKTQEQLSQTILSVDELSKLHEQLEKRAQALQSIVNQESQEKLKASELNAHIKALQEYQLQDGLLQKKQAEGLLAKDQVDQAFLVYETSRKTTIELEVRWHLGQAAILAGTLQNDQACPVCGSLDHPQLAQWQDPTQAVDKAQLEAAQAETNAHQQKHAQAENHLTGLRSEFEVMKLQLDKLEQALSKYPSGTLEELHSSLAEVEKSIKQIEAAQTEKTQVTSDLQSLKQQRQELDANFKILQVDVNTKQTQVQLKEQAWKTIQSQLPESYRNSVELLNEIQNIQNRIQKLKQAQETMRIALDEAKSSADKAQQSLDISVQQLSDLTFKVSQSEQQWQETLAASDFSDDVEFKAAQWTQAKFEETQQSIKNFEEDLNQLNGAIKQLKVTLKERNIPDLTLIREKVDAMKATLDEAENSFNLLDHRMVLLKSVQEKLCIAQEENQKLLVEYRLIGTLSEVLSGREGDKVNLQRFVLSLLLDDVLQVASERLKMMSKGRYELIRKEERSKGNKASGLDLEIFDTWNNSSRGVATLSGGESFMAALSLALGLSEVVQSYSGGIKLDTLFIDEGFGSLDQDSLDLSIETLKQLQANGRSIGIISHVTELKEQMANRIDVVPSLTGSSVKVIAL
jgi:exonuclease SbcC